MIELTQFLDNVRDQESFLKFVEALIKDREDEDSKKKLHPSPLYGTGVNGWENSSIESYLEAAVAWGRSTNMGETQGLKKDNLWKTFATFLYLGKIYE
jgi:hypothetical protein